MNRLGDFYHRLVDNDLNQNLDIREDFNKMDMFGSMKYSSKDKNETTKKIITINATTIADRYKVTDWLKDDQAVLIMGSQMQKMDELLMKEFISGYCHANHGKLTKVSDHLYLAVPSDYDVINGDSIKNKKHDDELAGKNQPGTVSVDPQWNSKDPLTDISADKRYKDNTTVFGDSKEDK